MSKDKAQEQQPQDKAQEQQPVQEGGNQLVAFFGQLVESNKQMQEVIKNTLPKGQAPVNTNVVTASDGKTEILEREAGLVIASLQRKQFDPDTGKNLYKPFTQKFDKVEWYNFLDHSNGISVVGIINLPNGVKSADEYNADKIKAKEARAKEAAKAAAEAAMKAVLNS